MGNNDNKVLGTVGALVGAVIAMGVYLLLGRLGVIAAIAGFVAFITIFGGYYMLGKDMSAVGLIICVVILIATVYISNRLDWAISISKELKDIDSSFSVSFCYKHISEILTLADAKGKYILNLVLSYVFTVVGGFSALKKFGKV